MKPRVLVTDGGERAALAVARSLGRTGHEVYVCSGRTPSLAGVSRFCRGEARVPDPLAGPESFAAAVADIAARWRVEMVIPITEAALLALLPERERLSPARVPFPEAEAFRAVCDKGHVLEAASRLGIATPAQVVLEDPGTVEGLSGKALSYPLVVKPSRSVGEANGARVKLGVRHAAGREELRAVLAALPGAAFPVLLQQRIVGPGTGLFLLLWDGEVRAVFAHRRIREKPPSGGVSVCCESIAADPGLVERAAALLRAFGWQGVAMVEFKMDAATRVPYLMEVNGRFWGSLQLAVDAGVDFPALLVEAASGSPPALPPGYRTGVRSRWWWGEVDHLLARLRRPAAALDLPPGAPGRSRTVLDFLTPRRPAEWSDGFRLHDPGPFLRESLDWIRRR